jgi:hypothetical protein
MGPQHPASVSDRRQLDLVIVHFLPLALEEKNALIEVFHVMFIYPFLIPNFLFVIYRTLREKMNLLMPFLFQNNF